MKKIITLLTFIFLFSGALFAQVNQLPVDSNAGEFKFDDEKWDFGSIPQNHPVTHKFSFTNVGKEPIVVTNCAASGPVVAGWPKDPILPGMTSEIKVTYNAAHAGGFQKTVTITSNAKTSTKTIVIKGYVIAAPPLPIDSTGEFKFEDRGTWDFGEISPGKPISHDFHFTNVGYKPIIISNCHAYSPADATWPKEPILPGQSGVIKVTYNISNQGKFEERITIHSNAVMPDEELIIRGAAYYSSMEQSTNASAGVFKFDEETYNFGNLSQNKPVTHDFHFTNVGKEPIVITGCLATCGCTSTGWPKEPVNPGKTGIIHISFNASHQGIFNHSFTVISNAKTFTVNLSIIGYVEAEAVDSTAGEFKFAEEVWDFGKYLSVNKPIAHDFYFTNIGKVPLLISSCHSAGGPDATWPIKPIFPGEKGVIHVTYSVSHIGEFIKSITIISNAKSSPKVIFIKGSAIN